MVVAKCSCGNEIRLEWNHSDEFIIINCPKCNKELKIKNTDYNPGDETQRVAENMARMMNYRLHAENLYVPVLKELQEKNDNNPQTILLASGNGLMEQLTSDGYIKDGEFEERIELVIKNSKIFMKNHGCDNVDNSIIYYKDYNNGVFDYKLYVQDLIMNTPNGKKVIRNFIAYFVEPVMHDFYQVTLGIGPLDMPTEVLKTGIIDLENDSITNYLDYLMKIILDNLKYKK